MDSFLTMINQMKKIQLTTDNDPNNTELQQFASPYDTVKGSETIRALKSNPANCVWGDGTTYPAIDAMGNPWDAPSCGWLWGLGALWGGFLSDETWNSYSDSTWSSIGSNEWQNL